MHFLSLRCVLYRLLIKERLNSLYGLEPTLIERSLAGVGSDIYFVTCADGKYVVKFQRGITIYIRQAILSAKLLRCLEKDSAIVKPLASS